MEQNRPGLFSGRRSPQTGQVSRRVEARAASAARSLSVRWIVAVMDSRGVLVRVCRAARREVVVCWLVAAVVLMVPRLTGVGGAVFRSWHRLG